MANDPAGSTWKKWDLHVHTPFSVVHNYQGTEDEAWEAFFLDLEALPPEFKVIGINDYIFIDGYTSDDNPFSEAQFKTLKYRPDFPERFGSIEDARAHCQTFFAWYNDEHRHGGIAHMTPHSVHYGLAQDLITTRQSSLDVAFAKHPNRFKGQRPVTAKLPTAAWINPPLKKELQAEITTEITPITQ